MEINYKYPVIIKKKIPYVSATLKGLFIICFFVVAIAYFFFVPSAKSGNEMKTVVLLNSISETTKWFIFSCGLGFMVFYILYKIFIFRTAGYIEFSENSIILTGKNKIQIIPVEEITSIEFFDGFYSKLGKIVFHIFILRKEELEDIDLKLKDYTHSEEIIDKILLYERLRSKLRNIEEKIESRFLNT